MCVKVNLPKVEDKIEEGACVVQLPRTYITLSLNWNWTRMLRSQGPWAHYFFIYEPFFAYAEDLAKIHWLGSARLDYGNIRMVSSSHKLSYQM